MKKIFLFFIFLFPLVTHAAEKNLLTPQTIATLEVEISKIHSEQKHFFLKNELENIGNVSKKPKKQTFFHYYFPKALSLHNLHLFLASRNLPNKELNRHLQGLYKKASKKASPLKAAKCKLLIASLLAEEGNAEKANALFNSIDPLLLEADYNMLLYQAHYFAVMNNTQQSLHFLQSAFKLRQQETLDLLEITDDFFAIKNEKPFQDQLKKWKHEKKLWAIPVHLKVPKAKQAQIQGEWKSVRYKWSLQARSKRKSPVYLKQFKPLKI